MNDEEQAVIDAVRKWLITPPARLRVPDPENTDAWNTYINHVQAEEAIIEAITKLDGGTR